ncbi:MAG: HYC_CC_PP family protein [Arcticibacter sp.]
MGTNNHSLKNGLAIALAIIFLASSLGIAKVSHYCRMAEASVVSDCCETDATKPSCCTPETEKQEDCCTNQVQVFKADYQSSAPSFSNLKIKATNVESFFGTIVKATFCSMSNGETHHWPLEPNRPPGPSTHLLYSVFLI